MCYEQCGNCRYDVEKNIPGCGHSQKMQCATNPCDFVCQMPCNKKLGCGHNCQNKCGEGHTGKCEVPVKTQLNCGHQGTPFSNMLVVFNVLHGICSVLYYHPAFLNTAPFQNIAAIIACHHPLSCTFGVQIPVLVLHGLSKFSQNWSGGGGGARR